MLLTQLVELVAVKRQKLYRWCSLRQIKAFFLIAKSKNKLLCDDMRNLFGHEAL